MFIPISEATFMLFYVNIHNVTFGLLLTFSNARSNTALQYITMCTQTVGRSYIEWTDVAV